MTEDELKSFLKERRTNLNKIEQESRMDETEDSIQTLSQFFDNIKNKNSKSSNTKKIQPESYNSIANIGNNNEEINNPIFTKLRINRVIINYVLLLICLLPY